MICVLCFVIGFGGIFFIIRSLLETLKLSNLKSRSVLVTGCDTGFGHDLVLRLLHNGLHVFAGCLTNKGQEGLECEADGLPGKLDTFSLDVTKEDSINSALQIVKSKTKNLWAIVNNAGIIGAGMTDWLQIGDYHKCLDVNTFGVIRVTEAFKPFIKKSHGRIITVTSQAARNVTVALASYTVSKYATGAYCDTLRLEMVSFGVSVHVIEPGFVKTHIMDKDLYITTYRKCWDNTSQEIRDQYGDDFLSKMIDARHDLMSALATKETTPVINSLFHAITAVFPRRRYSPDVRAKILTFMSILPTYWQDKVSLTIEMAFPKPKSCCR